MRTDVQRHRLYPALIALLCLLPACGGSGTTDRRVATETFATWDEYLQHSNAASNRQKVVFIGLDGATWELIDPMIARGLLPNFQRLKDEGAWGQLLSTETYVSPPAWTAMMTGFLPERTGIYTFGHWSPDQQRFLPLRSTDVLVPTVWDIASLGGARTAAINVPVTYPVRDINGIMVSGLLTPTRLADRATYELRFERVADPGSTGAPRSYEPLVGAQLERDGNRFDIYLVDPIDDGRQRYTRIHVNLSNTLRADPAVYRFDVSTFSNWMKINVATEDGPQNGWTRLGIIPGQQPGQYYARFSHVLWSSSDTDVQFTSPPSLANDLHEQFDYYFPSTYLDAAVVPGHTADAARWASFFLDYDDWDLFLFVFTQTDNILHAAGMSPLAEEVFRTIDGFLGDLMAKLPDDHTIMLASDHGFTEYKFAVDLNRLFEALGLVTYRNEREIDHDRTVAFHNMWGVYYNDALLTPSLLRERSIDCQDGDDPRDALTRFIRTACPRYLSEVLHHDVPLQFTDVPSEAAGLAPDLFITGTRTRYQIEFWNINKPRPDIVSPLQGGASWFHTRRGMFLIRGPGVRAGVEIEPTDIQNVTPTFLYLLGLPAPTNIDGRLIDEAFDPAVFTAKPKFIVSDYATLPKTLDVTDDRREDLEKQLRSLGYVR